MYFSLLPHLIIKVPRELNSLPIDDITDMQGEIFWVLERTESDIWAVPRYTDVESVTDAQTSGRIAGKYRLTKSSKMDILTMELVRGLETSGASGTARSLFCVDGVDNKNIRQASCLSDVFFVVEITQRKQRLCGVWPMRWNGCVLCLRMPQ